MLIGFPTPERKSRSLNDEARPTARAGKRGRERLILGSETFRRYLRPEAVFQIALEPQPPGQHKPISVSVANLSIFPAKPGESQHGMLRDFPSWKSALYGDVAVL